MARRSPKKTKKISKEELNLKLRFIEFLFIVAIFLVGIEQAKVTSSNALYAVTALFLLGGLAYYSSLIIDSTTGFTFYVLTLLTSFGFSGILAIFLGIVLSLLVAIGYFFIIGLMLLMVLSKRESIINFRNRVEKMKQSVKNAVKRK